MNLLRRGEDVTGQVNRRVAKQKAVVDKLVEKQTSMLLDRAAEIADRVESVRGEVVKRVRPRPSRRPLFLALGLGVCAGYAIAYFTDPDRGRSRRAEIGRQLGSLQLEATRAAQRTATVAADRATAVRSRMTRPGPDNPNPDDLTLLDRVESEVFADPSIPKGKINVMVVDGKAVLRGQVEEPQIGAIESAVRKVVGVRDVENLLHPAGTPAPNKAASRTAGIPDDSKPS